MEYKISGMSKIILGIYIMLSAHKGGFIYDRELGSDLYRIDYNQENAVEMMEVYAREALREFPFCEVKSVKAEEDSIKVKTEIYGKEYDIDLKEEPNGIQL